LRQYRPLFAALGAFELVYVASDPRWLDKAERLFCRFYPEGGGSAFIILPSCARLST
jgi:hypothetical protein